jgi:hypothetical protein
MTQRSPAATERQNAEFAELAEVRREEEGEEESREGSPSARAPGGCAPLPGYGMTRGRSMRGSRDVHAAPVLSPEGSPSIAGGNAPGMAFDTPPDPERGHRTVVIVNAVSSGYSSIARATARPPEINYLPSHQLRAQS